MLTKKNRHTRYDLSFQSSLPFISFKRAQSRNLWTFMFGFTPTALINNSILLFFLLLSLQSYLSGCPSGLPNDGGVGLTQQRLSKVRLLLQHLARLIHPTAAERKR